MIHPYLGPYISSLIFRGVANSLFGEHETAELILKNFLSSQLEVKWCINPGRGKRWFLPHHISADLLGKLIFSNSLLLQ